MQMELEQKDERNNMNSKTAHCGRGHTRVKLRTTTDYRTEARMVVGISVDFETLKIRQELCSQWTGKNGAGPLNLMWKDRRYYLHFTRVGPGSVRTKLFVKWLDSGFAIRATTAGTVLLTETSLLSRYNLQSLRLHLERGERVWGDMLVCGRSASGVPALAKSPMSQGCLTRAAPNQSEVKYPSFATSSWVSVGGLINVPKA
ncbi:hypothetical protein BDW02DRAFT_107008 [Decorospora gaudefroyi]|uniref:Uncharacterized protein n=1 Tax=Decorospora gaudefroyi TaxID=184978 RepID=A0A6A5KQX5_9PLEO|nr:hypothetical protein BDW02DRAFT_107008 [Decorospora gaudefroyi]